MTEVNAPNSNVLCDYRKQLSAEFQRRKLMNSRYSLRAFAKAIGFSPAFLSKLLRGDKNLSPERAFLVAGKLGYTGNELLQFVKMVQIANSGSDKLKDVLFQDLSGKGSEGDFAPINLDSFQVISDWYHYAILELSHCQGFKPTASYISKRIRVPKDVAEEALERLKGLGLLKEIRGTLVKTNRFIATPSEIPSQAIRNYHTQMIFKAKEALENQPVNTRDITAITMAIKKEDLDAAKKEIKIFRGKMSRLFETARANSVFQLNIQFFPLDSEMEGVHDL